MLTLKIPEDILQQMLDQARAEDPVEACGILAGSDGQVRKLYKMTNADDSSEHFAMVPTEQFMVVKNIRASGLKMLAIYHSHPETPARPSQEDRRLALTPDVTYVILSLMDRANPAIMGFDIENGSVTEVPIEIVQDT